jgi:thiol:disulfide interchange protein
VFTFGVSYAVASLPCTLPILLAVVAGAIPSTKLPSGVLLFVIYGLGMSLVLVVVTLALALGKHRLVGRLRRSTRYVHRISGGVPLLAGAYIVWFWSRNLSDPLAPSATVTAIERWSSRLTGLVGDRPLLSGGILAALAQAATA